MSDLDAFLESTMPRLKAAETALHNGDASLRVAMWSRNDPLTLFGAAFNGSGWAELGPTFDFLASRFSDCTSWQFNVVGAGVSGRAPYRRSERIGQRHVVTTGVEVLVPAGVAVGDAHPCSVVLLDGQIVFW